MNRRTSISLLLGAASLAGFLACGGGGGSTPPPPPAVAVTISPTTANLVAGTTQQFTATVTNTTNTAVNWSVQEGAAGGTVSGSGLYTAPATAGTYHVVATSAADATKTATATVTVTAAPATSLAYVDPTTGTYRLVKNTSLSTNTHLVLDLLGTGAPSGAGVAFTLTADAARLTWTKVAPADAQYVANGVVLNLGSAPLAITGKVTTDTLKAALGQKGTGSSVALNGVLASVAVDLKVGAPKGTATLAVPKAKILAADGTIVDMPVTVGTITAN